MREQIRRRGLENYPRHFIQLDQSAVNNKEKCDQQGKDYIPITATATGKVKGNKCVDHTVPTKIKRTQLGFSLFILRRKRVNPSFATIRRLIKYIMDCETMNNY